MAPAERRVVRSLLADYPLTGLEPVAVVAERAGTSAPTVLRVVGKLGLSGFPEFQRVLRAELAEHWTTPLDVMPRDSASGLAARVRAAIRAGVTADLDRLAAGPDVEAATALLTDPGHTIWTVGGRASQYLADYLALHLQVIRPGVRRVAGDPGSRHMALLDIARRDVVVAFDFRRFQRDTVEFGTLAVERGARLVLFTGQDLSPLAADAQAVLATTTDTGSSYTMLSPAFAAVEALLIALVERSGGAPRERLERYDRLSTEVVPALSVSRAEAAAQPEPGSTPSRRKR
jgi:DNA-binding MurR/RpiR family transcriptional regulator